MDRSPTVLRISERRNRPTVFFAETPDGHNGYSLIKSCKEDKTMITVNLYYTGTNGSARRFAQEMESSGTAEKIRAEKGNVRYEYFFPMNDPETVLLIDAWEDQEAIDVHHASAMMKTIMELREKYDLHMKVERYVSEELPESDEGFVRN